MPKTKQQTSGFADAAVLNFVLTEDSLIVKSVLLPLGAAKSNTMDL